MKHKSRTGEELRPSPQLKTLYYIVLSAVFLVIIFPVLAILFFVPFYISVFFLVPFLLIMILVFLWIPRFYQTITYKLTRDDMTWRRGVWFRNTGIVPYNRITNVDISQGPLSRALGIASLKIQTAGYSAPNTRSSEIKIEGMTDFEELRETIMNHVRGRKPVAVETYETESPGDVSSRILSELVRIRKALEKK